MQSAEIELKFPVSDPLAFQSRLPTLGFQLETPRTFEHNVLYDTPTRDLRTRGQILRIRQYGPICTVTHKRKPGPEDPIDTTRYKIRIETETAIAEGAALDAIFRQLGYAPAFTYDKYRSEWSHTISPGSHITAHLVLDETPIGTWAELEGPHRLDRPHPRRPPSQSIHLPHRQLRKALPRLEAAHRQPRRKSHLL